MTKRKSELHVKTDLSDVLNQPLRNTPDKRNSTALTIHEVIDAIIRQMKASGLRQRTLDDYTLHVNHFVKVTGVKYLDEIDADRIYEWLSSMNVSNQTKLTRLKCLKAFLGRCLDNGWVTTKFWRNIRIKVDSPVKEGATDREITILFSLLDLTKFVELRDATAVLLMYQTGIRIGTLSQLETKHIEMDLQMLKIDGGVLKNHQPLYLPFNDTLATLFTVLMEQNDLIRKVNKVNNDLLFITNNGTTIATSPTNNNIIKRLGKYAKDYGLKNINPHALRRGFAKNLLNKGANIALISKALGHSDIAVTTRYLHLDTEEVAEHLRDYL